jgi:peptide subunit release factor 1 (eRF1)
MISREEIEQIVERKSIPGSPVLSVYIDIDQSKAINLKRHFKASLEQMLRAIEERLDEEQLGNFSADAEGVRQYISGMEARAKGLVLFCDESEKFFWAREIKVAVRNNARWAETPYVAPLLQILDEYERYGVVLVDREHARLFTVFMGEIQEHQDALAPLPVRRTKTTGTDQWLSARKFQSKADTHAHWHLKHVAETLDKIIDQYRFDRLLLGGPIEPTTELKRLLSKRARTRVIEQLSLPIKATEHEVLQAALEVEQRLERELEKQIVENLIAGGDGHHPFTLGLEATVRALSEERIWQLIYAARFNPKGGRCSNCGMLFAKSGGTCDYCGGAIQPLDDLLEQMIERVLEQDGKIEEAKGDAALRLDHAGSIGAVLRF